MVFDNVWCFPLPPSIVLLMFCGCAVVFFLIGYSSIPGVFPCSWRLACLLPRALFLCVYLFVAPPFPSVARAPLFVSVSLRLSLSFLFGLPFPRLLVCASLALLSLVVGRGRPISESPGGVSSLIFLHREFRSQRVFHNTRLASITTTQLQPAVKD